MITEPCRRLVAEHGQSLFGFYRAVYKGVDCGPTIGFLVNGVWIYNDDLPPTPIDVVEQTLDYVVRGVCVSSIVEGSDVEIEPIEFVEEFDPKDFWEAVDRVNREASFYWTRDNSEWYQVVAPSGVVHIVRYTDGDFIWKCGPEEILNSTRVKIETKIRAVEEDPKNEGVEDWTYNIYVNVRRSPQMFVVSKFVNDSTF